MNPPKEPVRPKKPIRPKEPSKTLPFRERQLDVYDGLTLAQVLKETYGIDPNEIKFDVEYDYDDNDCYQLKWIDNTPVTNTAYDREMRKYKKNLEQYDDSIFVYEQNMKAYDLEMLEFEKLDREYKIWHLSRELKRLEGLE